MDTSYEKVKGINPRVHVIGSQQFDKDFLNELFKKTSEIKNGEYSRNLEGKTVALLFYEPSTRTRLSFDMAAHMLGAHVFSTENAKDFSSAVKGESIEDTVRVVGDSVDIIVIRHYEEGAVGRGTLHSKVPIINAGDGSGQHPTQALLDVYTIKEHLGRLGGLNVAMVGDLKRGRTVRSLAYLLSKFDGNRIWFISGEEDRMRMDILEHLREKKVSYFEINGFREILDKVDVLYMTRTQTERMSEEETGKIGNKLKLQQEDLGLMRERSIILHPLPRVDEIDKKIDTDLRAKFFEQSRNGKFVRAALLSMIAEHSLHSAFSLETHSLYL